MTADNRFPPTPRIKRAVDDIAERLGLDDMPTLAERAKVLRDTDAKLLAALDLMAGDLEAQYADKAKRRAGTVRRAAARLRELLL